VQTPTRAATLAALAALAAAASAQDFTGDTFSWSFDNGVGTPAVRQATVGPGPEFEILLVNRAFSVDIEGASITVTADFDDPSETNRWGNNGNTLLGQLRITGLDSIDGTPIGGAAVSGTAENLDDDDVELTADSVFIGASVPTDNRFRWSDGDTVRVDLNDGCPGPNVINVTSGATFDTIAEAIDASAPGDTLELGACTYFESRLRLNNRNITIRGQGVGQTVIDGEHSATIFTAERGDRSTIESMTIQNGRADILLSGGAFDVVRDSGVTLRDLLLTGHQDNGGGAIATLNVDTRSTATLQRVTFLGNGTPNAGELRDILVNSNSTLRILQSVFAGGEFVRFPIGIANGNNRVFVTNSTFANYTNASNVLTGVAAAELVFTNNVYAVGNTPYEGQVPVSRNNVYAGATGDDIDAAPVFVDAANGDLRLAAGSPGIDAADTAAYLAAGGGFFDAAGGGRFFDDPNSTNFDDAQMPLDAGAFEFVAAAEPTTDPCLADIAVPFGVLDLDDVDAFINSFTAGCP